MLHSVCVRMNESYINSSRVLSVSAIYMSVCLILFLELCNRQAGGSALKIQYFNNGMAT